jgi:hypothetical protein
MNYKNFPAFFFQGGVAESLYNNLFESVKILGRRRGGFWKINKNIYHFINVLPILQNEEGGGSCSKHPTTSLFIPIKKHD